MERSMETQRFKIDPPVNIDRGRVTHPLVRTDIMKSFVAVVSPNGGENKLHKHPVDDAVWIVLEGRVNFYGEQDKLIGTLEKMDGLLIPRDVPYWFENPGPDPLIILRVAAVDKAKGPSIRVHLDTAKAE